MPKLKKHFYTFVGDIRRSFLDLTVIIGVIAFFQFVILRTTPDNLPSMVLGLAIVGIGLALFMRGLEMGVFPLGENLATQLASSKRRFWVLIFAFVIGFATTIAEPALLAIAHKAAVISDGQIDALILRLVVAFSVGVAIVIGVVRIFLNHPIHWYIISGYVIALTVTYFAPQEIVGLAYDSGGVTTSTVTVPLIAALGIGVASSLKNRNPIIDGFGLIAFASLLPMIFVQLYGVVAYSGVISATSLSGATLVGSAAQSMQAAVAFFASSSFTPYLTQFVATIGDVTPIILTVLFFYLVVIRKPLTSPITHVFGFILVILGLYAFVVGLELGLFPVGETIAVALAVKGNIFLIYLFAFTIGFATTIAEPALTAIANKAELLSAGAIRSFVLRIAVASGVGIGILLGAYRIINGDSIVWYLAIGYSVVVILTFFAPKTTVPIAYDSGGVTTSTVTVPIVAALGLGLASSIPGRDPLIDGFGLIAFASLFPMVAVLGYGIFQTQSIKRHEKSVARLGSHTVGRILKQLKKEDTEVIQRTKKEIITITGTHGAGASSIGRALARRLRYQLFSAGDIFRSVAENRNVSVNELTEKAEADPSIDREIDEIVQELGVKENHLVIDSRLAYHWIQRSFKVFVTVSDDLVAQRIHQSIHEEGRMAEEDASIEHIKHNARMRQESKKRRYQELYGIDILNTQPFDLVIDTSNLSAEESARLVIKEYEAWITKRNKK